MYSFEKYVQVDKEIEKAKSKIFKRYLWLIFILSCLNAYYFSCIKQDFLMGMTTGSLLSIVATLSYTVEFKKVRNEIKRRNNMQD